jgi:hypothetical protein
MFVMHCTKKAQDRLKVKPVDVLPEPTTRLGNWYCNEFTASRRKHLIFVNERTLLPIVISVKGLKTSRDILEVFKTKISCRSFWRWMKSSLRKPKAEALSVL